MTKKMKPRGGDDANDPFLDDLLSFLDEPAGEAAPIATDEDLGDLTDLWEPPSSSGDDERTSSDPVSSRTPSPTPTVYDAPRFPTGAGSKKKRVLDLLRCEAELLTTKLCRLQYPRSQAMEAAMIERFKRRRAEQECQQLRDAVYAQSRFIRGLRTVFSSPPCFASSFNLIRYLHKYSKLPRNLPSRSNEYAGMAQEARMQTAMEILLRETESTPSLEGPVPIMPSVSEPFIQTELITDHTGFSVTTVSVYAVESSDLAVVLRSVFFAVGEITAKCQSYRCTHVNKHVVDPHTLGLSPAMAPSSNLLYRVLGVRHRSIEHDEELTVESRIITLFKQTDDYAVVLWDFVDDDELHPIQDTTDITRQAIGTCLLRRERCADGVDRIVFRSLNTRRYHFHDRSRGEILDRFYHATADTTRENELIFRGIVTDSIAKEEAAYASAMASLSRLQRTQ